MENCNQNETDGEGMVLFMWSSFYWGIIRSSFDAVQLPMLAEYIAAKHLDQSNGQMDSIITIIKWDRFHLLSWSDIIPNVVSVMTFWLSVTWLGTVYDVTAEVILRSLDATRQNPIISGMDPRSGLFGTSFFFVGKSLQE